MVKALNNVTAAQTEAAMICKRQRFPGGKVQNMVVCDKPAVFVGLKKRCFECHVETTPRYTGGRKG